MAACSTRTKDGHPAPPSSKCCKGSTNCWPIRPSTILPNQRPTICSSKWRFHFPLQHSWWCFSRLCSLVIVRGRCECCAIHYSLIHMRGFCVTSLLICVRHFYCVLSAVRGDNEDAYGWHKYPFMVHEYAFMVAGRVFRRRCKSESISVWSERYSRYQKLSLDGITLPPHRFFFLASCMTISPQISRQILRVLNRCLTTLARKK